MKKLFLLASAAGVLAAAPAMAEGPDRYVQGNIGAVVGGSFDFSVQNGTERDYVNQDADGGFYTSIAMGQSLTPKLTIEAEVIYAETDMELQNERRVGIGSIKTRDITPNEPRPQNFTISTYGLLLNANYEVYRSGKTAAYVGAGAGFGYVDYEVKSEGLNGSVDDDGLMWQLKAGVTRELTATTSLDVSYRYLNTPDIAESKEPADFHALTVGLRYSF